MVFQELDIGCKHAPYANIVFLHELEYLILLLNFQIIRILQRRCLLRLCVYLDLSTHCTAFEVKNALDSVGVAELKRVTHEH